MRLTPHGGVASRLKMLTYYRVCSAFSPPRAPDGKLGIYDLLRAHRRSRLDGAAGSFIRDWPEAVHDPE
jgi:hypothetical protein